MTTNTKKSFLGGIGELLFENESPTKAETPSTKSVPPPRPLVSHGQPTFVVQREAVEELNQQAVEKIEAVVASVLPPEFRSFQEQYKKLAPVISNESMRFEAALATSGCTREALQAALSGVKEAVDKAIVDFTKALQTKEANLKHSVDQNRKSLQTTQTAITEQIATLQRKSSEVSESLRNLEIQALADYDTLQKKSAEFQHAANHVLRVYGATK